jgi:Flp pilus assembly protein TadD
VRFNKKALGLDHMSTLTVVNNLGLLYSAQGKLKEAEVIIVEVPEVTDCTKSRRIIWT